MFRSLTGQETEDLLTMTIPEIIPFRNSMQLLLLAADQRRRIRIGIQGTSFLETVECRCHLFALRQGSIPSLSLCYHIHIHCIVDAH